MNQLETVRGTHLLESPHGTFLLPEAMERVTQTRGNLGNIGIELEDLEPMEV